ncbi:MAG TPA: hypothetical protein VF640_07165 [Acidimicrobiales bacterium]
MSGIGEKAAGKPSRGRKTMVATESAFVTCAWCGDHFVHETKSRARYCSNNCRRRSVIDAGRAATLAGVLADRVLLMDALTELAHAVASGDDPAWSPQLIDALERATQLLHDLTSATPTPDTQQQERPST